MCRPMCAGLDAGRNGVIRNGLKVFGSGELVWKTDVFGVLSEFRSEFRSASAPLGGGAKVSSPWWVSLVN